MRNFITFIIISLLTVSCGGGESQKSGETPKSEDIVLNLNVIDKTAGEVVVIVHGDVRVITLDENGGGSETFTGLDAAYGRVFYGNQSKLIYMEKGDNVSISFNGKDFNGSFSLEGEKAPAVKYLNTIVLTALPDEDYALPFDEFYAKIKAKEQDAIKLMKANGLEGAGDFVKMEEGRIKYSYAAPLLMHPVGHMMMTGRMDYQPDQAYYDVIKSYMEDNPQWADLDEFRSFAVEAAHALDAQNRSETSLYPKTVAQMKYIADCFKNEKVRGTLLHYLAASYIDNFGIDNIQELENIYRTYVKDEALINEFQAKYDKWDMSTPGKPSPALNAVDVEGQTWTLEDFRGKYVYIDMWATWCAPCRREIPYLKELEEKFKDAEIVFLGLSIDGDKSKWEEMIASGSLTGVQLYLGPRSEFQQAYKIEGIPRFILLDKEGVIINNDMTRPSAPETLQTLEALDGIR